MERYDDISFLSGWETDITNATDYLTAANNNYNSVLTATLGMVEKIEDYKRRLSYIKYPGDGLDEAFDDIQELTSNIVNTVGVTEDEGLNATITAMLSLYATAIEVVYNMINRVSSLTDSADRQEVINLINSGKSLDDIFDTQLRNKLLGDIDYSDNVHYKPRMAFEVIFADIWKDDVDVLKAAFGNVNGLKFNEITPQSVASFLTSEKFYSDAWKMVGVEATSSAILTSLDLFKKYGTIVMDSGKNLNLFQRVAGRMASNAPTIGITGLLVSYSFNVAQEVLFNGNSLSDINTWVDAGAKLAITELAGMAAKSIVVAVAGESAGSGGGVVGLFGGMILGWIGTTLYDKWKEYYYSNADGVSTKYDSYKNTVMENAFERMGYDFVAPTYSDSTTVGGSISAFDIAIELKQDGLPQDVIDFVVARAGVPIENEEKFFMKGSNGEVFLTPTGEAIADSFARLNLGVLPERKIPIEGDSYYNAFADEYNSALEEYGRVIMDKCGFQSENFYDYLSVGNNISNSNKMEFVGN